MLPVQTGRSWGSKLPQAGQGPETGKLEAWWGTPPPLPEQTSKGGAGKGNNVPVRGTRTGMQAETDPGDGYQVPSMRLLSGSNGHAHNGEPVSEEHMSNVPTAGGTAVKGSVVETSPKETLATTAMGELAAPDSAPQVEMERRSGSCPTQQHRDEKSTDERDDNALAARQHSVCPIGTRKPFSGYELMCKVNGQDVIAYVDSGSTANYIAGPVAERLGLKAQQPTSTLCLADGTERQTTGRCYNLKVRCGKVTFNIDLDVFTALEHEIILGLPWLVAENPRIDFKSGRITVVRNMTELHIPIRTNPPVLPNVHKIPAVLCTPKEILSLMHERSTQACLAVIRPAQEGMAIDSYSETQGHLLDDVDLMLKEKNIPSPVANVLKKYRKVFAKDIPPGIPPIRKGHEFSIELEPDTRPIFRPIYKLSPAELDEVKRQIDYLLRNGFIKPSKSPWGAPILFVPKKDGGLRMCVDYRWLNKVTIKNRYPLPLPEELIDRMSGAKVFSKIDLRSGYWQMPIRPSDTEKTAFRTRYGHFEMLVVPFGLTNAPPHFTNMIQDLLCDMLDDFVVVFLDDICIYSQNVTEHAKHVEKVLARLAEHKLFAKGLKCDFAVSEVEYLGYVVSPDGLGPMQAKVKAIAEWKTPRNVSDVRSFLGLVSYYRKFIPNFARIAAPLNDLVKKDVQWQWGTNEQSAMRELQDRMQKHPLLILPRSDLPYTVITDASQIAYGAVLTQDHGKGMQPIAYLSKKLTPTEQRRSAYERELGAIAYALVQWRHYLEGADVTILTDHKPLTSFMDQNHLSRTQASWITNAGFFSINPTIKYIKGKANVMADALSRSFPTSSDQKVNAIARRMMDLQGRDAWIRALAQDAELQDIIANLSDHKHRLYSVEDELLYHSQSAGSEPRLVVPETLRGDVLSEAHDPPTVGHVGVDRMMEQLSRKFWWKGMRGDVQSYIRTCPTCQVMKSDHQKVKGLLQPLEIPTRKWQQITTDLVTDLPESQGYTAVAVFVDRLTKYVKFVPCTKDVTAEQYARFFMDHVFRHFGLPEVIVSDRDPRFTSHFWTELFRLLQTKLRMSTAYHPQSDGQSEVSIRTLENFLRPYVEDNPSGWAQLLPMIEFAANNAKNASTGYTPFFLLHGQHPDVAGFQSLRPSATKVQSVTEMCEHMQAHLDRASANYKHAQDAMCRKANVKRRDVSFSVGDEVLVSTKVLLPTHLQHLPAKIRRQFVGPFKITKRISAVAYKVALPDTWRAHPVYHISRLKKFHPDLDYHRAVEPPKGRLDEEGHLEYDVQAIINHKGKGARRKYLIAWKGYPLSESSWEPVSNLRKVKDMIAEYLARIPTDSTTRKGRGFRR